MLGKLPCDFFSDSVLYLKSSVDFNEVEPTFAVNQELHSSCVGVADMSSQVQGTVKHSLANLQFINDALQVDWKSTFRIQKDFQIKIPGQNIVFPGHFYH